MKPVIVLAIAVLAAGCTQVVYPDTTTTEPTTTTIATTTTQSTTTTTEAPTTTIDDTRERERAFVITVRDFSATLPAVVWVDVVTDFQLVDWGYQACDLLDETGDLLATLDIIIEIGMDIYGDEWYPEDDAITAYALGAAVGVICPHNMNLLNESEGTSA